MQSKKIKDVKKEEKKNETKARWLLFKNCFQKLKNKEFLVQNTKNIKLGQFSKNATKMLFILFSKTILKNRNPARRELIEAYDILVITFPRRVRSHFDSLETHVNSDLTHRVDEDLRVLRPHQNFHKINNGAQN